ncbi:MAG: transglycosylase domain-containing protein [Bdellovibrio sp.]|nr:transglycosylase domain-containing protein [Bdellovibrio sp.]
MQKVKIKKIYIYLALGSCSLALLLLIWIVSVVSDFSFENWIIKEEVTQQLEIPIELEKSSSINTSHFNAFQAFFVQTNTSESMKNTMLNPQVGLREMIKLQKYYQNDCVELNCYQHRTNLNGLPSHLWKTLISIEDFRFLDHQGIDFFSIFRAAIKNLLTLRLKEGGSTLTQQLVKNLFLSSEKTFYRKIKEAIISLYLEAKFDKKDILEIYLNEVYWGSLQGVRIKGIYAASIFYFNKTPLQLKNYESAILISLLKGPNLYGPLKHPALLRTRVSALFKKLKEEKHFSIEHLKDWSDTNWKEWMEQLENNNQLQGHKCFEEIGRHKEYLSYDSYVLCLKSKSMLRKLTKEHSNVGWSIKGQIYNLANNTLSAYYSRYERDLNKALLDETHSIGSIIKPIVFDVLVDLGIDPDEEIELKKMTINLPSGQWTPKEAGNVEWGSKLAAIDILRKSLNNPMIDLAKRSGFLRVEEGLKKYFPKVQSIESYPSQLLGTIELSVNAIIKVYSEFLRRDCQRFNDGKFSLIDAMADPSQTTIAHRVNRDLKQMRFFGKTGTTNFGQDNWFVFITGDILGAIWVGNEMERKNEDTKTYGSSTAFQLFQDWVFERGKRFSDVDCATLRDKIMAQENNLAL